MAATLAFRAIVIGGPFDGWESSLDRLSPRLVLVRAPVPVAGGAREAVEDVHELVLTSADGYTGWYCRRSDAGYFDAWYHGYLPKENPRDGWTAT